MNPVLHEYRIVTEEVTSARLIIITIRWYTHYSDKIKLLVLLYTSISVSFIVTLFTTLNTFIKWPVKNLPL